MEIQKGEWYFAVECSACALTIYFSHDPSKGMMEIAARDEAVIQVACPFCNSVVEYHQNELISRQAE